MLSSVTRRAIARAAFGKSNKLANVYVNVQAFSTKSWIPTSDEKLQQVTMKSLIHEVAEQQRELAGKVVPWFLKNMPAAYFRQVPEALRSQHVKAITALKDLSQSDLSLKIDTKFEDQLKVTFINTQAKTGLLHRQLKSLNVPEGYTLTNVNVFSSLDGELALNVFTFDNIKKGHLTASQADAEGLKQFVKEMREGRHVDRPAMPEYCELYSDEALNEYFTRITPSYAQNSDPRRFLIQRKMFEQVKDNDGCVVNIEPYYASSNPQSQSWITVAAANVLPEVALRLTSAILSARGFDIGRAHLDSVDAPETSSAEIPGQVTMLRLLVTPPDESRNLNTNAEFAQTLSRDLRRAKWLDNETTELGLNKFPHLGLDKAEVITALTSLLHGPLYKLDPNNYSSIKSMLQIISGNKYHVELCEKIAALFLDRFNPANPLSDADFNQRSEQIRGKIKTIQTESARLLVGKVLDTVHATLRTNFYNENRYALSLRLNPMIMMPPSGPTTERPLPFGVFFIHGRHFNAFHNRFKDIARGGLRIVTPQNSDQYALESTRQYDEVYGLSHAQQLKNKDIPEGGSKGVVLVNTPAIEHYTKFFAVRKSIRAFSDALLDLIVKDSVSQLVDKYGKDELIYLGPDEQIIPSDIEWIINRAGQRGYPLPDAFMSSKAENGFNHKDYGVTSEGVKVYLDVALRKALKINPDKQPFTIKITGGPDGDVAGNLIRILFRDYGSNCKVVGIADGFGVAEDPEGLDADELLRLFKEGLPIDHYNPTKVGREGVVLKANNEEGITRRNTMHMRVKADVFVPAGGRPNSINSENWHQFLDSEGKPTSSLIVEGANIFTTPDARKQLFEKAGVVIVKDSSANKCGVITSSCEVQGCMLLSKKEFVDIKPKLVEDVLERLRLVAKLEGELLFREFQNYPGALPHFSERISYAIGKVRDAVTDALADVGPEDELFKELRPLIAENLPKKLVEVAGDRIASRFPVQYQRNAIACALATKLVYQEGIHLVESQPYEKVAERAFSYYREDLKMRKIIADLEAAQLGSANEHKDIVIDLLKRGGTRASLDFF